MDQDPYYATCRLDEWRNDPFIKLYRYAMDAMLAQAKEPPSVDSLFKAISEVENWNNWSFIWMVYFLVRCCSFGLTIRGRYAHSDLSHSFRSGQICGRLCAFFIGQGKEAGYAVGVPYILFSTLVQQLGGVCSEGRCEYMASVLCALPPIKGVMRLEHLCVPPIHSYIRRNKLDYDAFMEKRNLPKHLMKERIGWFHECCAVIDRLFDG